MKKIFSTKYSESAISLGLLLLRVISGSTMLVNHGMKKLSNFDAIAQKGFADPFHIGAKASLGLAIFAEVACAALLIVGLITRLATIPLIITMCVALFLVGEGKIFGEGESAALFLVMYVFLLISGPGKYSLDKALGK